MESDRSGDVFGASRIEGRIGQDPDSAEVQQHGWTTNVGDVGAHKLWMDLRGIGCGEVKKARKKLCGEVRRSAGRSLFLGIRARCEGYLPFPLV